MLTGHPLPPSASAPCLSWMQFFDVNAEAKSATALSVAIGNLVTSTESEYSDFRPTPGLVPALPAIRFGCIMHLLL